MFDMSVNAGVDLYAMSGANADLGAGAAYDLWHQMDAVSACADFSENAERYETSLFRFPQEQRRAFAALNYLKTVEEIGHEGYFNSTASFGFDEACACFEAIGAEAVVELLQEASLIATNETSIAVGQNISVLPQFGGCDRQLAKLDPVNLLRSFTRRHAPAFSRW